MKWARRLSSAAILALLGCVAVSGSGCNSENTTAPSAGSVETGAGTTSDSAPPPSDSTLEVAGAGQSKAAGSSSEQMPLEPRALSDKASRLNIPDFGEAPTEEWRKVWLTSFEKAKAKAQEEKKDILMNFTGSDWCGWCIRLGEEVFSQPEFNTAVEKQFVLLELDFPREKELPPLLQAQNESLNSRYRAEGFPTVILTDATGRPYGRSGYQPGGAELYLTHLSELRDARVKRDAALEAASKAEGVEKAKQLDLALSALPGDMLLPEYQAEIDEVISLDADGSAGLQKKYRLMVDEHHLRDRLSELRDLMTGPGRSRDLLAALDSLQKEFPAPEHRGLFIQIRINALEMDGRWDDVRNVADENLKDEQLKPETRNELLLSRIISYAETKRLPEAITATDDAIKLLPEMNEENHLWLLRFHLIKAQIFSQMKPRGDVKSAFDAAMKFATPDQKVQLQAMARQLLAD